MPPWHIAKNVGIKQFKNDRSLTDDQIDTIVRWVDAGAPLGDVNDLPPPVEWPDPTAWRPEDRFGVPDLLVRTRSVHDASRSPGQVVSADHRHWGDRATLGPRHRDQPLVPGSLVQVPTVW